MMLPDRTSPTFEKKNRKRKKIEKKKTTKFGYTHSKCRLASSNLNLWIKGVGLEQI